MQTCISWRPGKPCLIDVCEYPDPDRDGPQRVILAAGSHFSGQTSDVDVDVAAERLGDSGVQLGVEVVVVNQVFSIGGQRVSGALPVVPVPRPDVVCQSRADAKPDRNCLRTRCRSEARCRWLGRHIRRC